MRRTTAFIIVALVSVTLMVPAVIWAQSGVIQQSDNGSINWSTGKVTVVGIDAPPTNPANMAHARAMARPAAITVARRNLLEITQGVVRNAQLVDTAYMSDGPVEVRMVMNMNGEFADVFMPRPPVDTQPVVPEVPEPMSSEGFTGLVIDARGLGTRPAMSPKI